MPVSEVHNTAHRIQCLSACRRLSSSGMQEVPLLLHLYPLRRHRDCSTACSDAGIVLRQNIRQFNLPATLNPVIRIVKDGLCKIIFHFHIVFNSVRYTYTITILNLSQEIYKSNFVHHQWQSGIGRSQLSE